MDKVKSTNQWCFRVVTPNFAAHSKQLDPSHQGGSLVSISETVEVIKDMTIELDIPEQNSAVQSYRELKPT